MPAKSHAQFLSQAHAGATLVKSLKAGARYAGFVVYISPSNLILHCGSYKTSELTALDRKVVEADGEAASVEGEIFREMCSRISVASPIISAIARALAALDVTAALAEV